MSDCPETHRFRGVNVKEELTDSVAVSQPLGFPKFVLYRLKCPKLALGQFQRSGSRLCLENFFLSGPVNPGHEQYLGFVKQHVFRTKGDSCLETNLASPPGMLLNIGQRYVLEL